MIEEQERGWSSQDDMHVCSNCFRDEAIKQFIEDRLSHNTCDYCGNHSDTELVSTLTDYVIGLISESISTEWGDPNEELPYESAEGGYQGEVFDSTDLFFGEVEDIFENDDIREAVVNAFNEHGRQWCQKNYFALRPEDIFLYGWEEFSLLVKHHTRYLFSVAPDDRKEHRGYEEIPPGEFLTRLGSVVNEVGLVSILSKGSSIYRSRVHKATDHYVLPSELGPPTIDKAIFANRMSPAGIPMFYGAFDEQTAIDETISRNNGNDEVVTVGKFISAREIKIIDLSIVPEVPSLFDSDNRHKRPGIIFLKSFISDLSKQINSEDEKHYEYVPTQIVTEYFRKMFRDNSGDAVDGIVYNSSINKHGKCCVLFYENKHCCSIEPDWENKIDEDVTGVFKWWLALELTNRYAIKK